MRYCSKLEATKSHKIYFSQLQIIENDLKIFLDIKIQRNFLFTQIVQVYYNEFIVCNHIFFQKEPSLTIKQITTQLKKYF